MGLCCTSGAPPPSNPTGWKPPEDDPFLIRPATFISDWVFTRPNYIRDASFTYSDVVVATPNHTMCNNSFHDMTHTQWTPYRLPVYEVSSRMKSIEQPNYLPLINFSPTPYWRSAVVEPPQTKASHTIPSTNTQTVTTYSNTVQSTRPKQQVGSLPPYWNESEEFPVTGSKSVERRVVSLTSPTSNEKGSPYPIYRREKRTKRYNIVSDYESDSSSSSQSNTSEIIELEMKIMELKQKAKKKNKKLEKGKMKESSPEGSDCSEDESIIEERKEIPLLDGSATEILNLIGNANLMESTPTTDQNIQSNKIPKDKTEELIKEIDNTPRSITCFSQTSQQWPYMEEIEWMDQMFQTPRQVMFI